MTKENLEQKFPAVILSDELIKLGAKQIPNITYYELEADGRKAIYEPSVKNKNGKITSYSLRGIIPVEFIK